MTRTCAVCGAEVTRPSWAFKAPPERTTCGRECRNRLVARTRDRVYGTGADNPHWKGGEYTWKGYVYVRAAGHPRTMANGYVKRATLVLEKKIGRFLEPGEFAHHKNEVRGDDSPGNLEVNTRPEHQRYHVAKRHKEKTDVTGQADAEDPGHDGPEQHRGVPAPGERHPGDRGP